MNPKQQAANLLQQDKHAQALDVCKSYCKTAKKDAEGFFLLGNIYGAMGNMKSAVSTLRKAVKLQPKNPQLHFNLSVALQKSGNLPLTRKSLETALQLKPNFFEAHFNLTDVLLNLDLLDEAYSCSQKAYEINPEYAPLHLTISSILVKRDEIDGAILAIEKAIELNPSYDDAYINLGKLYCSLQRIEEAEQSFKKAIEINPNQAHAYIQLGILKQKRGELDDAYQTIKKAVTVEHDNALAYYNLGILLRLMEKFEEAIESFQQALVFDPEHIATYIGLAEVQRDIGAHDRAMDTLKSGLKYKPQIAEYYLVMATVLGHRGNYDGALVDLHKAVELEPDNPKTHINLAHGYYNINQYDKALASFERGLQLANSKNDNYTIQEAIAGTAIILERRKEYDRAYSLISPYLDDCQNPRIALVLGSLSTKHDCSEKAIAVMDKALYDPNTSIHHKTELNFQLGKIHDTQKNYSKAFEYYSQGTKYYRLTNSDMIARYKLEDDEGYFNTVKTTFSKKYFCTSKTSDSTTERPVFVVGMPRSGTTLTETILSNHASVFGAGELRGIPEIRLAIESETNKPFHKVISKVSKSTLTRLATQYLQSLNQKNKSALRVVDKLPHNFLSLGLIAQLFPEARIINIQRYPTDNCLSIYFQRFSISHTYASDLVMLGNYYQLYSDMMQHWQQVLPLPIFNIKYDDLVSNQESVSRQMIEFCGLDWDPNCLTFHQSKRDINTPSYDQVSQPMYTKSSGRWRNYEQQIQPLILTLEENGSLDQFHEFKTGLA